MAYTGVYTVIKVHVMQNVNFAQSLINLKGFSVLLIHYGFHFQLQMLMTESSKFPIMLGMICYWIKILKCLKIWLERLKLAWMNFLLILL